MHPSGVVIRTATSAEDVAAAAGLLRDYARSLSWDDSSGGWLDEEIAALPGPYVPPRGALLLALADGRPAGVLGLQPVPEEARIPETGAEAAGELKRLYVHPEFRRRGIGRALVERAEEEARGRGYESVVLTTAPQAMPLAQGLYDALRYVEAAPYRDDMPWPGIRWMRKDLAAPDR